MTIRRPALIDTGATFAASVAAKVVGIPTSVLIARALGPTGKGSFALVMVVVGQVAMLLSLGVDVGLVHYAGRRRYPIGALAGVAVGFGLLLGVLGAVVAAALLGLVFADRLPTSVIPWAYVAVAAIPGWMITANLLALLRAQGRLVESAVFGVVTPLTTLVAASVSVIMSWGVGGILGLNTLGTFAVAVTVSLVGIRFAVLPAKRMPSQQIGRSVAAYGLRGHMGTIFQGLNYRLDLLIVALFLSLDEVGFYSVSVSLAEMLWIVPNVFGIVLLQRSAVLSPKEATALTGRATRLTSALLFGGVISCGLLSEPLVHLLFGVEFMPALWPLLLLLPGTWALGIWKNLINDLAGRGYPGAKSITAGTAVIVTIGLDVLLIPQFGIAGAALATSCAYLVACAGAILVYKGRTDTRIADILVPKKDDLAAVRLGLGRSYRYLVGRPASGQMR